MLTFNGTKVNLLPSLQPAGYIETPVTEVVGPEYTNDMTITVDRSTLVGASGQEVLDDLLVKIGTQVQAELNASYDTAGATVEAHAELESAITNFRSGEEDFWSVGTINYVCSVKVKVKTT